MDRRLRFLLICDRLIFPPPFLRIFPEYAQSAGFSTAWIAAD